MLGRLLIDFAKTELNQTKTDLTCLQSMGWRQIELKITLSNDHFFVMCLTQFIHSDVHMDDVLWVAYIRDNLKSSDTK